MDASIPVEGPAEGAPREQGSRTPVVAGWPTTLLYALPVIGFSVPLFFIQFYFLKFATDVLLLAPSAIGLIFGLVRATDAVVDPVVGYWSDRTSARLGRRRPWMLAGIPLMAVSLVMLWKPLESLTDGPLLVWSGLALLGYYLAFTFYTVPHQALGAELTDQYHERTRIFGIHRMVFTLGMLLSFVAIQMVGASQGARAAAGDVAIMMAVVTSLVLLVPPLALRERVEYRGRGGATPFKAMRDVLKNHHARLLFAVWFIDNLGAGAVGILAPYVTEYVTKRPDLIGVVPAFFVFAGIASIPLWILLSRRIGKRLVFILGMIGSALFFGATFFVGEGDLVWLCILLVGAGASMGCTGAIAPSILADVIDYDELETGERKEGAYSAVFALALKLAIGLMIVLTGIALELSGFVPNAEQTPDAQFYLRLLFAGPPAVAFLAGAIAFRRFSLSEAEHDRIHAALGRGARA